MSFVFSADGHIVEPTAMYSDLLPETLRSFGIRAEKHGDYIHTLAGNKLISRIGVHKPMPKMGVDGEEFGRSDRKGAKDFTMRFEDLALDGVDAEIIFPTLGITAFLIENPDAEYATAQIYNDWLQAQIGHRSEVFVRCGILPVRDFDNTIAEMHRLAKLGFTSGMLPSLIEPNSGIPNYSEPAWDKVFEVAQNLNMVFVLHTGTGRSDVRSHRGPGGAVVNYTIQACDGMHSVMTLVAGGVLDRFPDVKVCIVESGASWLAALSERMDEVYFAHDYFVRPKLSIKPSEIIARQIACSFQVDRACIMSRSVTGTKSLMWASDYPHHEGTFPHSRKVLSHLFDNIEISETEKADIIGLNGARLFRIPRPELTLTA